jgi:RNA-directed DNA polymerase
VVTARTKETLEQIVKPVVVDFLAQRGLELSEQKTTITHINTGFNFLGQNVRKYKNKLVIKAAKDGVKALVQKARACIKGSLGQTAETLIRSLNPIIRGWTNFHRHVCSAKTFWNVDHIIHYQLLRWARRTHPHKSYGWLKAKYFTTEGRFGFYARIKTGTAESKVLRLHSVAKTIIERHIKVRGEANPYDPNYTEYFERRRSFAWRTLPCRRTGQSLPAGV